jgi:hypothetical protein
MNNPYAPPYAPPPGGYGQPPPYAATAQPGVGVSPNSVELLRQTRPWVMFLSILMFIGSGFMLLGGIAMMGMGATLGGRGAGAFPGMILGAIYLPLAFVYIYPAVKLWSYASAIGRLNNSRMTEDLESALGHQKSFWKFCGILTIVLIALYIVFFLIAIVGGVMAAGSHGHF